jgi:hypothetical protein
MNDKIILFISKAVHLISEGVVKRLDSPNEKISIYQCGTVIRIDLKEGFNND